MEIWKFDILQDWFESFSFTPSFWSWSNWTVANLNNLILVKFYTWSWSFFWEHILSSLIRIKVVHDLNQFNFSKFMFDFVWFDMNQTLNMIQIKSFFPKNLVSFVSFDPNQVLCLFRIIRHLIWITLSLIRINWHLFQKLVIAFIPPHLTQLIQIIFFSIRI